MKKFITLPNMITLLRMSGTFALFFISPPTALFYIVYTFCGFTDVLDGFVARLTKKASNFGAKLDSAADIFFYTVMLIKMFPALKANLPLWIWIVTVSAIAVRACSYLTAAVRYRKFASQHTYLNKLSGLMLFLVPYFEPTKFFVPFCAAVAIECCSSSVEEFIMHLTEKEYDSSKKTIIAPLNPKKQTN